jgi:hypothetical protein
VFVGLLVVLIGLTIAARTTTDWLQPLWPLVDLDIGPAHQQIEKLRRGRLAAVVALILIALAVAAIYDILKATLLAREQRYADGPARFKMNGLDLF